MHRRRHLLPALVVTLIAIVAGAAVARAESPTPLLGYQFELVDIRDNGNHTSTWTYAVTASGDEAHALSHWTLALGACYMPVVTPANGASFATLTSTEYGCGSKYNCEVSQCTVEVGKDPTTNISNGIKFGNCNPQLEKSNAPRTQIYQFTVDDVPNQARYVTVADKAGNSTQSGQILGPACSPTAVSLRGLSAEPEPATGQMRRSFMLIAMALGTIGMRIANWVTRS